MKSAMFLALTAVLLSACSLAPFEVNKKNIVAIAPDIPAIPKPVQKKAAMEMLSGQCPAENAILNSCLLTRDESRLLLK